MHNCYYQPFAVQLQPSSVQLNSPHISSAESDGGKSSSRATGSKLTFPSPSSVGGQFTRQVEVTFLPGNEKLTIRQEFKGIDEHDHLVMSTTLEGRVPEVPHGADVQIEPYSEIYQYSNNCKTQLEQRTSLTLPPFLPL